MGYKISDAVSVEPSSPEGSLEGHVLNLVMSDDGLRGAGIALETRQRPRAAMREGSTLGSPGVNRIMILLLLSVLGSTRSDPQIDSRSGAIS